MHNERTGMGCEDEAAALLPWLVAGALSDDEIERVEAHVRDCAVCVEDLRRERAVRVLVRDEAVVEHAPQPGLQRLMSRIDEFARVPAGPQADATPLTVPRRARVTLTHGLAAAVVVQAIGLGILGALLWQRGVQLHEPRFQTLATSTLPVQRVDRIRVVFATDLTLARMHALMASISATVVAGPSEAGVYTLSLSDVRAPMETALAKLRADEAVLFAEPQTPSGERPP